MAGIGIVNNPRSRRNRRQPAIAGRLRRLVDGDGEVADAATLGELAEALERFRAARIDVLAVNGGDGTGHVVLSALASAWDGARLPKLLLLRGGAMNTVAHGMHVSGGPEAILAHFLQRRRAGAAPRTVERDLLRVSGPGVSPRLGFIFGTGAVVEFLDAYYGTGRPSPATAAALVVRAVASAVRRGPFAARLTAKEPLRVLADGEEWPEDRFLSVIAATVPEIGFGFRPFHRFDEQPGFFHAIGVTCGIGALVPRLPAIRRGKPWPRTIAIDAVARDLSLEAAGPVRFTIDGDLYATEGTARVETGPPVEIIVG
jgi:diacylglycerol kinase family enzyme